MLNLERLEALARESIRRERSLEGATDNTAAFQLEASVSHFVLVNAILEMLPEMRDRLIHPQEESLKALISEHEHKLHFGYASYDKVMQIRALMDQYERTAADAILDAQQFQADLTNWLQGLALCAEMVSNGQTHAEKNARMRGLVELIGSALSKIREYDWKLSHHNRRGYRPDDLFDNDYPVRHFKDRAERAERELADLKKRLGEAPVEGGQE